MGRLYDLLGTGALILTSPYLAWRSLRNPQEMREKQQWLQAEIVRRMKAASERARAPQPGSPPPTTLEAQRPARSSDSQLR